MSSKKKKGNLLTEKISSLIHAKPSEIESDNDDFTTVDKIAPEPNDSEYSADELDPTKFRKINSSFLAEDDVKYSGRGVSRKELLDLSSDGLSETEENVKYDKGHGSSSISEIEEEETEGEEEEIEDEDEKVESEEEESEIEEESGSDLEKSKISENIAQQFHSLRVDEGNFNKEIFSQLGKDIEKGKAINVQLQLWDFLLECRMKFQNCLIASNQFPDYKNVVKFIGNSEFDKSVAQTKKSLRHLLKSLLSFQETLLNSNEEFINSVKGIKKSEDSEVDSELESENEGDTKTENNSHLKLDWFRSDFKKLHDFSHEINKRHKNFENYRNNTIQKWNDKTRIGSISSKNFSAFEQSVLKQIEQVLRDKQRLITRTQIKRSNYCILGLDPKDDEPPAKKQANEESENSNFTSTRRNKMTTNKEIFDDDDFYHQFLCELIKRKANNITDPVQLGRQWMQLQKIRKKMKKTLDTKASKGRKVRFVVHPKLVNFMMPTCSSIENENSRMELINSLFGMKKNIAN